MSISQGLGSADPRTRPAVTRRMTSAGLATWRALLDTTGGLRRVVGAELQETSLSPADYQVLLALTEAQGERMRSSRLARTIDWERSRLSHQLGRMERRQLIRRDDCASDSRGAEVSLTAEGARVDALTPDQFAALADILRSLQNHLHPYLAARAEDGQR